MPDDRDELATWFECSAEQLPPQPFTLAVMKQVRRHERRLRLQRFAAIFTGLSSAWLLLPELAAALNAVAALPMTVAAIAAEQWPVLIVVALLPVMWLVRQARAMA